MDLIINYEDLDTNRVLDIIIYSITSTVERNDQDDLTKGT